MAAIDTGRIPDGAIALDGPMSGEILCRMGGDLVCHTGAGYRYYYCEHRCVYWRAHPAAMKRALRQPSRVWYLLHKDSGTHGAVAVNSRRGRLVPEAISAKAKEYSSSSAKFGADLEGVAVRLGMIEKRRRGIGVGG